jgi:hypothetical protein
MIFFMVVYFIDVGDLQAEAPRHHAQIGVHRVHGVARGREADAHVELTPALRLTASRMAM